MAAPEALSGCFLLEADAQNVLDSGKEKTVVK